MPNESENGKERTLYNNQALCEKIGVQPKQIRRFAAKAGVSRATLIKAMDGDPKIGLTTLVAILEAAGAEYCSVFDPVLYEAHKPKAKKAAKT